MQSTAPVLDPQIPPIFKSLLNPLQTPYCHYSYLFAMAKSTHFVGAKPADPILQDIVSALISFYAKQSSDASYAIIEKRLFHQTCVCVTISPHLQPFHSTRATAVVGSKEVVDLSSFLGILSRFTDDLINNMLKSKDPSARAWRRKLIKLVNKQAAELIQSFAYLLRRTDEVRVFALFGTLIEMSPTMVDFLEQSSAVREAFDERFHALVTAEQGRPDSATDSEHRVDFIFHGAGCLAFVSMLGSRFNMTRFRACFLSGAQRRYEDICCLLSMKSRANKAIQDGTLHDTYRLARFGADLHRLNAHDSTPLSPLITAILEKMPQSPNGFGVFADYFAITDYCSNPIRHRASNESDSPKDAFRFATNLKAKRGDRLHTCANCNASKYCDKMCQKESWKGGKIPHRDICPILAQISKVHEAWKSKSGNPQGFEQLYSVAGISTAEVEKALGYVIQMMECFSDYVE